jgi:hypothetical protein
METDSKRASQRVSNGALPLGRSEIGGQLRKELCPKNASLLIPLSVSRFPQRHPVLYGSLLELRSFGHRIRFLVKRGGIRPAEIGPVYQQSPVPGYLVRNTRSQARIQGIQKLLSDSPWLTTDDCHLFLAGWDSAEEWRASSDTAESGGYSRDLDSRSSSARANATPPQGVQQSTRCDLSVRIPSQG